MTTSDLLPVIIVGAGPCGLVAALTLQRQDVPFVIIEKATRSKICSNAGSGFELAPTALKILRERLEIETEKILLEYAGANVQTLQGKVLTSTTIGVPYASVQRANMQKLLLEVLFPTPDLEEGYLKCGAALDSYEEDVDNGRVTVHLGDGSSLVGCALLGCDGIHSKVRQCIHVGVEDPLHFCNCLAYWAKCTIPPSSELEIELNKTQIDAEKGPSFVMGVGSSKDPGSLFVIPWNNTLLWGLFFPSDVPPQETNDLTRRGGGILTERGKLKMMKMIEDGGYSDLIKTVVRQTEASDITEAGIFDRKNLDLSYSSEGKLIAILGDAAHPQSPFLGQGVNMAIADGYTLASRIALGLKAAGDNDNNNNKDAVTKAISAYDSTERRNSAKMVVEESRSLTDTSLTTNWFKSWAMQALMKWLPMEWILADLLKYDKSNEALLKKLDDDFKDNQKV